MKILTQHHLQSYLYLRDSQDDPAIALSDQTG